MKSQTKQINDAVNRLKKIRDELKMLGVEEKELDKSIVTYMEKNGKEAIETGDVVAKLTYRPYQTVDPEAYFEALGRDQEKLLETVNVRLNADNERKGARSFLGEDAIKDMCETTYIPVIRVSRAKKIPRPQTKGYARNA